MESGLNVSDMDYNGTSVDYNLTRLGSEGLDFPLYEKFIEAFVLTAICITAFGGNTSLWIIVLRDKSLQNTSSALLLCLSAADWLVSVVNMPVIVYTIMKGDWMFSNTTCVGLGFMTMLTFVASVMSLGTISFNRYVHICHPQKKTLYTAKKTALWIAGTWTLSACLASPPLFGWGRYRYRPGQSFCFADWPTSISYTFFMVGACFGGPCTAMTFCYVNILRTVRKSKRKVGMSTPISSAANSPAPKSPSGEYFGDSPRLEKFDSTMQLHPKSEQNKAGHEDLVDLTSENKDVNNSNNDKTINEYETNHQQVIVDQNQTAVLKLNDNTVTESSPDNMYDTQNIDDEDDNETKTLETKNGNIQRRIKKSISHDSTVRKSYRAGIINSIGSNSSLDKDIQREITATEQLQAFSTPNAGSNNSAKRKLSFGTNSNKRKLSAGKKLFGNFLTVPGKKTLRAEDLAEKRKREKEKKMRAEELRLTTSLFVVIIVFVFCWLPFCCTMFWAVFADDPNSVPRPLDMATLLLGCANSMCNPIIYGVMNRRFGKGFHKLFCYFRNRALNGLEKTDGSTLQMNSTLSSK